MFPASHLALAALVLLASARFAHAQEAAVRRELKLAPDIETLPLELRDPNAPPPVEPQTSEVGPIALRYTPEFFRSPAAVAEAALEGPSFAIARYQIEGPSHLDPKVLQETLRPYTGPSKDFETIQSAVAALERVHAEAGVSTMRVTVPEQDIEGGVVRLKLIEAKVDKVEVVGNKHFSEDNIRRSLPGLREGTVPDVNAIGDSLRLANENPSKYSQLTFKQTTTPEKVDAVVRVADAETRRAALSYDNTGTPQTGRWRLGLSYQDANLWDRDHQFGFQVGTSPNHPGDVVIVAANYRVPLYTLGGAIEAVAGHSSVNSGVVNTPGASFGIKGAGDFAGVRYIQLLPKLGQWDQRLSLGLDFRYFKSNVQLVGSDEPSLVPDLQTLPLTLTYSGFLRNAPTEWNASIAVSHNIPVGKNGTTEAFQRPGGRAEADANYTILRYSLEVIKTLPADWRGRAFLTGQRTNDALIPGEQLALGGSDYVRGFAERAVANDHGDRATLELITPPLDAASLRTQARGLVFYDAGIVRRNKALPGETTSTHISSAGLGLRVNVAQSAQLRIDSAYVLQGDTQFPKGSTRTHAKLLYLF